MAQGFKTGGRRKGSINKKKADDILAIEQSGETPLDYMIRVMRDATQDHQRRDDMAKSAAPYLHAKLAASENKHEHSGKLEMAWLPTVE